MMLLITKLEREEDDSSYIVPNLILFSFLHKSPTELKDMFQNTSGPS